MFAARNVLDKLRKVAKDRASAGFYLRTYVLSRFDRLDPDVYIVSYPKCGRTWVRILLREYTKLLGHPTRDFNDRGLIEIGGDIVAKFEHGQGNWVPAPPRIESLEFDRARYRNKKVVFLVRDPRDVLVSSWYHLKFREHIYRGELSEFIRDELVGIEKVVAFMNLWMEHGHETGGFLVLTYEDLHRDPENSFSKLLEFVGLVPDEGLLRQAMEASSFDQMKAMEIQGSLKEPWMRPGAEGLDRSLKVRRGKIGGFRKELKDAEIAYLDGVIRERLTPHLPYGAIVG